MGASLQLLWNSSRIAQCLHACSYRHTRTHSARHVDQDSEICSCCWRDENAGGPCPGTTTARLSMRTSSASEVTAACRNVLKAIRYILQDRFGADVASLGFSETVVAGVEFSHLSCVGKTVTFECSWRGQVFTQDSDVLPASVQHLRCSQVPKLAEPWPCQQSRECARHSLLHVRRSCPGIQHLPF